jgi:hypothetical protein
MDNHIQSLHARAMSHFVDRTKGIIALNPVSHYTTATRMAVTWLPKPFFLSSPWDLLPPTGSNWQFSTTMVLLNTH